MALTAESKDLLRTAANVLCDLLQKFGLVISIDKTKTMIINFKGNEYPPSIIKINNDAIENVTHFTYLGAVISHSEPGMSDKELERRIGLFHNKFAELKKLLCNYHLRLCIRMKFCNYHLSQIMHSNEILLVRTSEVASVIAVKHGSSHNVNAIVSKLYILSF